MSEPPRPRATSLTSHDLARRFPPFRGDLSLGLSAEALEAAGPRAITRGSQAPQPCSSCGGGHGDARPVGRQDVPTAT